MLIQAIIAITGILSIWLVNDERREWARWACIIGLIGQPFWIYSSLENEQWGIFVLSIIYVFAWLRGLKQYWLSTDSQVKR